MLPRLCTGSRDWMAEAACRQIPRVSMMFPSDSDEVGVREAKAVCAHCPVREACLQYALSNRIQEGVWGGASESERRRALRRRHSTI